MIAIDANAIMIMQPAELGTHILFNYALLIEGTATTEAVVQETLQEIVALINT